MHRVMPCCIGLLWTIGAAASQRGALPAEVFVVQAGGTEFKLLHTADLGDNENTLRSAIPISQGQLFVRTSKTLFCIGRK